MAALLDPYLDPATTAVLVIDMQNGFCHPDSVMERSGVGTAAQRGAIPGVLRLVAQARRLGLPVLWSQQVSFPDDAGRRRQRPLPHRANLMRHGTPCAVGTWEVDLVDELEAVREPADHVVEKHRASVFFQTTLEGKLRMMGVHQLVIAGVNTEYCVETTVRDAFFRDLDVVVVRDAVAGRAPFADDALERFAHFFALVVSVDELPGLVLPARDGQVSAAG